MTFLIQLKEKNEILFYFGLANLIAGIAFFILACTTTIALNGVNAWLKPFKFALSTTLYSWAMVWYCNYLTNFNISLFNWTIIITLGFEVVYISFRASRAELSHYNTSSTIASILFSTMVIAATIATLYTAYVGILYFTNNFPALPNYYVWSIRFALILFVVFAFEGFAMGAGSSHSVGGSDNSIGIPILNWSKKFGDLRIAHFIGMHALQVLPLMSYYIIKSTKGVLIAAFLYALLSLYTLTQALNGKPLVGSKTQEIKQ